MKKIIAVVAGAIIATGVVSAIIIRKERNKIKNELKQRDPEELLALLNEASVLLEMEESLELDEANAKRFAELKAKLLAKQES